ncbi:hypothetical protein HDU89_004105 [Geranomyces variabilis]|nr:hypothetical protein HDU89_004105 [Geranomyces variabilis]
MSRPIETPSGRPLRARRIRRDTARPPEMRQVLGPLAPAEVANRIAPSLKLTIEQRMQRRIQIAKLEQELRQLEGEHTAATGARKETLRMKLEAKYAEYQSAIVELSASPTSDPLEELQEFEYRDNIEPLQIAH